MLKGQNLYRNQPIYMLPNTITAPPEEFRDITDTALPGVLPYYMVSNYGRLWHKFRSEYMHPQLDARGYLYKPLQTYDGNKNMRIHRLVLLTFCYIPGCEDMQVNHIDGVKTNNCIWNLEWSDCSENALHSYRSGLNGKGTLTQDQAREVCKLLEDPNITVTEIAKRFGVSRAVVTAIQTRTTYKDISKDYNFHVRRPAAHFTDEEIKEICCYYENNLRYRGERQVDFAERCLRDLGFEDITPKQIRTAMRIYRREIFTYISDQYNFSSSTTIER